MWSKVWLLESKKQKLTFFLIPLKDMPYFFYVLYGMKVQILFTSTKSDLPIDSDANFLRNESLDGLVSHENIFPPLIAQ